MAQVAAQLDIAGSLAAMHSSIFPEKFRPLHLRYLQYLPQDNSFKLLLDKGSLKPNELNGPNGLNEQAKELMKYFFIGLSLPNDSFWVNLRPDSPDEIIDPYLAQTDIGKILLEADLELKKDTARATSPQTPEGKKYWDSLYKKAGELFGSENVTIPTLTRPWIVPDEIIIRETADSAYVYKATLKVMLEQDYLKVTSHKSQVTGQYQFNDPRLKELNEYSTQLIKETIIPKLTKEINTSKKYASLRQVYYSLILAQWFKARQPSAVSHQLSAKTSPYLKLINSKDLTNLSAKEPYSVNTYFNAYKENFAKGEYNLSEPIQTPFGQSIRSYFSGGFAIGQVIPPTLGQPTFVNLAGTKTTEVPVADPTVNVNRDTTTPLIEARQGPNGEPILTTPLNQTPSQNTLKEERRQLAIDALKGLVPDAQLAKLVDDMLDAIVEAHLVGGRNPDGSLRGYYTAEEIAAKARILEQRMRELGITGQPGINIRRALMEKWVTGIKLKAGVGNEAPEEKARNTPLDILDTENNERWSGIVRDRWHDGVDFSELFTGQRVLILGDTNHGFLGIQKGLVERLRDLKKAGATHLLLEISSDLSVDDTENIAERTWIPHRFKQLVERARSMGIEVVFMDMPYKEKESFRDENEQSFQRGVYMGKFIDGFMRDNPNARAVAVTGFSHIKDLRQIPAQLGNIPCRMLGVVSEGQYGSIPGISQLHPLLMLSVSGAVADLVPLGRRYGYIDLNGLGLPVEGIIHLPRPTAEAPTARNLPPLLGSPEASKAITSADRLKEVMTIRDGQITKPAHLDFSDRVSDVYSWQDTNEDKILGCISQLEGITDGQKLYLAALLFSFAQNTSEHSLGGSILTIGFVPEGQFFEIETVDTHHYRYDPNVDYGSFKQHWEVSLRTLQEKFGFQDLAITNIDNLPSVNISNNPDNPRAIIKMIPLILAAITHPQRVVVGHNWMTDECKIRVFYTDQTGGPFICELKISDFALSGIETKFMDAGVFLRKEMLECLESLSYIFGQELRARSGFWDKLSLEKAALRKTYNALYDLIWGKKSLRGEESVTGSVQKAILNARKNLRSLNKEEADGLLSQIDEAIRSITEVTEMISKFLSKNPDMGSIKLLGNTENKTINERLSEARVFLQRLINIRDDISGDTVSFLPEGNHRAALSPGASQTSATSPSDAEAKRQERIRQFEQEVLGRPLDADEGALIEEVHGMGPGYLGRENPDGTFRRNIDESLAIPHEAIIKKGLRLRAKFNAAQIDWLIRHGCVGNQAPAEAGAQTGAAAERQEVGFGTTALSIKEADEAPSGTKVNLEKAFNIYRAMLRERLSREIPNRRYSDSWIRSQFQYFFAFMLSMTGLTRELFGEKASSKDSALFMVDETIQREKRRLEKERLRLIFPNTSRYSPFMQGGKDYWVSYARDMWDYFIALEGGLIDIWLKAGGPKGNITWGEIENEVQNRVGHVLFYQFQQNGEKINIDEVYGPLLNDLKAFFERNIINDKGSPAAYKVIKFRSILINQLWDAIVKHSKNIQDKGRMVDKLEFFMSDYAAIYLMLEKAGFDVENKRDIVLLKNALMDFTREFDDSPPKADESLRRVVKESVNSVILKKDPKASLLEGDLKEGVILPAKNILLLPEGSSTEDPAAGVYLEEEYSAELDNSRASVREMLEGGLGSASDPSLRSGSIPQQGRLGGIDFRSLPIVTQAIDNLRKGTPFALNPNRQRVSPVNLVEEWSQIEKLVTAGITPSAERIKEYIQAASGQGNLDIEKVISCISDILRQEEEGCCSTEALLRDILVVLEASRSSEELSQVFLGEYI